MLFRLDQADGASHDFRISANALGKWNLKAWPRDDLLVMGEAGQLRLLLLGRSFEGFAIRRKAPSLEQAIPPLRDPNDELLATVKVLLAVNHSSDRASKVTLLLDGIRSQAGASAIPLLIAVERRSLLGPPFDQRQHFLVE